MSLVSLPVIPAQPDLPYYPGDSLQIFTTYTRASYSAAGGGDPPTGDPTKRPKYWFDSGPGSPSDAVTYWAIDTTNPQKPVMVQITMSRAEAAAVNIPGVHSYPAYVLAPTDAYTVDSAGNKLSGVDPKQLSTEDQAKQLATIWGLDPATVVSQNVIGGQYAYVWPADEPRRMWEILLNGVLHNVGIFLWEQNTNGVGAPGSWNMAGGEPNWISALPATQNFPLPAWPTPVRPLLANEAGPVIAGLMGGAIIYRTDQNSPYNPAPSTDPTSGGAGLSPVQAADLHHTRLGVDALLAQSGLSLPAGS